VTLLVALTTDLMDRSRLSGALPDVQFTLDPDADVVIVDLGRGTELVTSIRASHPNARIVCYGPHVDDVSLAAARAAGADVVLPRSRFFRDPAGAIGRHI
jgi:DNA-binding NarL/FixJ family response regulator